MSASDAKDRFSIRVQDYTKHRPGYPAGVLQGLRERAGLKADQVVVDVGSGTGISARAFLDFGCQVIGVEPNEKMRSASVDFLRSYPRFTSIHSSAEAIGVQENIADWVVAAQAFHWFDREAFKREALRILKPGGWLALIWNDRETGGTPFLQAYEQLLIDFGTDYVQVRHRNISESELREFFSPSEMLTMDLPSEQVFDFAGLKGRLLSSSYTPAEGHPKHAGMLRELAAIFNRHQENGRVRMTYRTLCYFGRVK